ncbi:MAG TPA: ABC transporter permease, partial [Bryobacteraceae bacterium]
LDAEVRSYFEIVVDRMMARGLSREQAMRAARLEFDGPEQVKQQAREARMGTAIETTWRDIRYAARALRKNPGFTAVAVLTLGLGIGANAAIFSLINAVMLRLLPVQHPDQLVLLTDPTESGLATETTEHGVRTNLSYPEFEQLRLHNTVFSGILAAQNDVSAVDVFPEGVTPEHSLRAHAQLVSGGFFQVLGITPVLGRVFTPQEDQVPGANPITVISYGYWRQAFAADPGIVGTTVRVGQGTFRIVGVAPPGFTGILVGADADFWFPMTMQRQVLPGRDDLTPKDTLWLQVMGRLAPGISRQRAEAGINVTLQQILRAWAPALPTGRERRNTLEERIELRPGNRGASALRGEFSDPLLLLMAMVGVVLLIACANIANLMLARASARQREIGVRLALGAARLRLIRQLLTESFLVAALGGALGVLLSVAGTRLLLALVSSGFDDPGLNVLGDWRVFAFTAAISLVTLLLFGLAPAIRGTRLDINQTLAANARGSIGGRGRVRAGRILGMAQVAMSLVLLTGAALFLRSLSNLLTQNLGYDRERLLLLKLDPAAAGYQGAAATSLYERVRERLQGVPGVRSATLSNTGLFAGDSGDHLAIEGTPLRDREQLASRWTEIGADYFTTLGIPLLRGRQIDARDAARGAQLCLINESFFRKFFPDGDAIGKHITDEYPTTRETFEIVGVVADSKEHGPNETKQPRFYSNISHPIGTVKSVTYLLKTSRDPASVASAVRESLQQLDRNLPILTFRTLNQQIDRQLIASRMVAGLAAFFALLALFMAAIGLYGVMSYSMSTRTNEIGIRMALGASALGVRQMVLAETLWMVTIGVGAGLPCALALARLLSSKLFGLSALDPASIAVAILVVVASGLLAGYLPAHRASRIDPMVSLRHD